MRNFNIKDIKQSKLQILIKYISCLLIIEFALIILNVIMAINNNKTFTTTEVLSMAANYYNKDESSSVNYKIEITNQDEDSYYIKVDCKNQNVVIYASDEDGQFTVPMKKMICSTGSATPSKGVYSISDKYEWRNLVGGVYGQYATRITGQILFHSVPYTKKDKSSLEYWEYDKLGQPDSLGCVRLTVEDAKWIFDNCKFGTKVEFCSEQESEEKLKVNQPKKISEENEELKGWDPTDPDENNPWKE